MKSEYLEKLEKALHERGIVKNDISDVIKDYDQMYQDALDSGKNEDDILSLLGAPKKVAKDLASDYHWKSDKNSKSGKLIALTPFIAFIFYMVVGLTEGTWHPTWLIFLLTPITAILLETKGFNRIISVIPFISIISFIILGTFYDLWNPGWLVFLLIPMVAIFKKKKTHIVILYELSYIFSIAVYLYLGYSHDMWSIGALAFILPLLLGIYFGDVKFYVGNVKNIKQKDVYFLIIIGLILLGFILIGLLFGGWAYAWQLFLLLPIAAIVIYEKFKFVSISPFIAVIIFFSLGYFLDLWSLSWLAFLIIPIAGIIDNQA
jgi:uncharacterized membrane protein